MWIICLCQCISARIQYQYACFYHMEIIGTILPVSQEDTLVIVYCLFRNIMPCQHVNQFIRNTDEFCVSTFVLMFFSEYMREMDFVSVHFYLGDTPVSVSGRWLEFCVSRSWCCTPVSVTENISSRGDYLCVCSLLSGWYSCLSVSGRRR